MQPQPHIMYQVPAQGNNQGHGPNPRPTYYTSRQPNIRSMHMPSGNTRPVNSNMTTPTSMSGSTQNQVYPVLMNQQAIMHPTFQMQSVNPYPRAPYPAHIVMNSQNHGYSHMASPQYPYTPTQYYNIPHGMSSMQQQSNQPQSSVPVSSQPQAVTQQPQQQQQQAPRKKIVIVDPKSGRDITNELAKPADKESSVRSTESPPGPSSSNSSSRATPPEDSNTNVKNKLESDIPAQFATQVALAASKDPPKVSKVETDVQTVIENEDVVENINEETFDSDVVCTNSSESSPDENIPVTHISNVKSVPADIQNDILANNSSETTNNDVSNEDTSQVEQSMNEEISDDGKRGKQKSRSVNEQIKEKDSVETDAHLDNKQEEKETVIDSVKSDSFPDVESSENLPKDEAQETVLEKEQDTVDGNEKNENSEKEQLENGEVDKENNDDSSVIASSVPPKLKFDYKDDQWSPINTTGKKQYDRNFLIQLQSEALSMQKPEGLPDLEVIKDKPSTTSHRNSFDFTPGYLLPARNSRGSMQSTPRRSSQQGRAASTKKINIVLSSDVKLHEVENAWRPNSKSKANSKIEVAEDAEVADLVKAARGILNKLTPQKFKPLVEQLRNLPINSPNKLSALISLIFDKALDEPSFSTTYAELCAHVQNIQVKTANNEVFHFKKMLLVNCQKEFEKDNMDLSKMAKLKLDIEAADSEAKKKELTEQLTEAEKAIKRRTLGNIRFIGELYKLQMLTGRIIVECIKKLIHSKDDDEDSIECLCRLLTTVGKTLDEEGKNKRESNVYINDCLDSCFNEMRKLINNKNTSSRIRFMMQDVLDLRQVNWKPRRQDFNPRTIDEIHKEAAEEALEQQILNNSGSAKRMDDRNSRKNKNNSHMNYGQSEDGWNTVHSKGKFPDANKIMQMQRNMDESVQLGPGGNVFKKWGHGSSGGNKSISDSMKPPAAPTNRFNALSNGEPDDGNRNYGSGRSGTSSRDSSRNRDRQMPMSGNQKVSHLRGASKERKELLNSVSNMTKSSSMPLPQGRDNSSTRKNSVNDMSSSVVVSNTRNIIDEYLHHGEVEEAILEFKRICTNSTAKCFVNSAINHVLERSGKARQQVGSLFYNLVKRNILSITSYLEGVEEIMQMAEDFLIDIPKFWTYIGEVIAPTICNDGSFLSFLKKIVSSLKDRYKGKLLAEILHASAEEVGPVVLKGKWNDSKLKWVDFVKATEVDMFITDNKLEFMVKNVDGCAIQSDKIKVKLDELLCKKADNDQIMDWIDSNVGNETIHNPMFIRALVTAVCESAIKGESISSSLNEDALRKRTSLLQKYLDNKEDLELHALFALQRLLHKLEHPLGVVRYIFECLYDEELISGDAFTQWENTKDPNEQEGHAVLMKSLTQFFTWLREPDDKF